MIKTIALIGACMLVAGCPATPVDVGENPGTGPSLVMPPPTCTQGPASTITVKYGDSKIDVTHKVKVKKNKFLKLTLNPDNSSQEPVDYKSMNVYLFGNTPDAKWLDGVYNAGGQNQKSFDICADAPVGHYKYMVVIPGVGTIDPRIEIEN